MGDLPWKTTSRIVDVFLLICFVCYDINTSLDAVECKIVFHVQILLHFIVTWTASVMTFVTVLLEIPRLDITVYLESRNCLLIVLSQCCLLKVDTTGHLFQGERMSRTCPTVEDARGVLGDLCRRPQRARSWSRAS